MSKHILTQYCMQTTAFKIHERLIKDEALFLHVSVRSHTTVCPDCGTSTSVGYDHRPNESHVRLETWYGHPIFLVMRKRRFTCVNSNCDRTVFTERLPDVPRLYMRHTNTFSNLCLTTLSAENFLKTQTMHRVGFGTLATMVDRQVKTVPSFVNWKEVCPVGATLALGIDEHSFRGRHLVISITNTRTGDLLALLPDAKQITLECFLGSIPSTVRPRISSVSMDLTNRYAAAVKRWCKEAKIAVDHFHIIQLANRLLWHERSVLQSCGKRWAKDVKAFHLLLKGRERLKRKYRRRVDALLEEPACKKLKLAYELKEKLRTIFQMKNHDEAVQRFLSLLRQDVWNNTRTTRDELLKYSKYFRTFIGTLQKFKDEIITFIQTRLTNAVTEGINTKIKLFKRMSYGYANLTRYLKRMILVFHPPVITHHI